MSIEEGFAQLAVGRPEVKSSDAVEIARDRYGLSGPIEELGSQQDRNFRIDADAGSYLLKISNPSFHDLELECQDAAIERLGQAGLVVPERIASLAGATTERVTVGDKELAVRLFSYVAGRSLAHAAHIAPSIARELGRIAAQACLGLAGFEHPGLDRGRQWDVRNAEAVVAAFASHVDGDERRRRVETATAEAARALEPLRSQLRLQAIHGDVTEDNVVCATDPDGRLRPFALIDFGDLTRSWLVAELAVSCASLLHHRPAQPLAVIPVVQAFDELVPLTDAELAALWPLITLRGAAIGVSDENQLWRDPTNRYAAYNRDHDWLIFETAVTIPPELAHAAFRLALGRPEAPVAVLAVKPTPLLPTLTPASLRLLDLSVTSEALDEGRWLAPGTEDALFAGAADAAVTVGARYGEHRLTRSLPDSAAEPETLALHVELRPATASAVVAPVDATVVASASDSLTLALGPYDLQLCGLASPLDVGDHAARGDVVGSVSAGGRLLVQLCSVADLQPPHFVRGSVGTAWRRLCPDPSPLLGLNCAAPALDSTAVLERRGRSFAGVQAYYYDDPPQIERGFRHHLVDAGGRSYIDMINNVTPLGHGHPRLARDVARQWRLLNTNSRFNYGIVAEFSERLAALAPDGLDTVLLVNSGTEACDLALRLAQAHTGRRIMLAVTEAYHGWSIGADAVSTSVADNPAAIGTRPEWTRFLDTPNTYRGSHRGPEAGALYAREAVAAIEDLARRGEAPGGFIAEAIYGNAGGLILPDGYLAGVYAAVRACGGVCIADEVQVGYGRLGHFFWGFEQQGVVPDVITIAKAMGNGQPLGAVITRREIADSLAASGSFFSSAGGSNVSSRVGLTVIEVLEEEGLQANAAAIGDHLLARLGELAERHPLIGAVHGMGLYIGVELVRDRETLEPATRETYAICERLRELGVIVQPTADRLNVLKVKPPLCITRESADVFVDRLDEVLSAGW